jgi:hypothetical protein
LKLLVHGYRQRKRRGKSKKGKLKDSRRVEQHSGEPTCEYINQVSTEVIETVGGLKEAKLKNVMDSKTSTDTDTNENTA